MARGTLIISKSGSGKSTSMRNLEAADTVIVNMVDKDLPYQKSQGFEFVELKAPSDIKPGAIISAITTKNVLNILKYVNDKLPEVKNVVLDDFGYAAVSEFMGRIKEKSFDKFNDIGHIYWSVARGIKALSRKDLNVFVVAHDETEMDAFGNKVTKFKTIGKITDKMIVFEGLFTIVLAAEVIRELGQKPKYIFKTQSDGSDTLKSPMGMFEDEIPNDLKLVSDRIFEYYK